MKKSIVKYYNALNEVAMLLYKMHKESILHSLSIFLFYFRQ